MLKKTLDDYAFRTMRKLCLERIEEIDPNRDACIALSGGTDSTVALFSALATGRKPECYTFRIADYISDDFRSAQYLCKTFGLKHHEIIIPSDVDSIYQDVVDVLPLLNNVSKVIIQCMIPWMYIYSQMEQKRIIGGFRADNLYIESRKFNIMRKARGERGMMEVRKLVYDPPDISMSFFYIFAYAGAMGKECKDLYDSKPIKDLFLQYELQALNKPKQKYLSVGAFLDFYKIGNFYRERSNYQINSRLRESHDKLLISKYNLRNSKAVIGIYNDIARSLGLFQDRKVIDDDEE